MSEQNMKSFVDDSRSVVIEGTRWVLDEWLPEGKTHDDIAKEIAMVYNSHPLRFPVGTVVFVRWDTGSFDGLKETTAKRVE